MKNVIKVLLTLLISISIIQPISVQALTVTITPDKNEAEVGETITYTVTVDEPTTINVDGEEVEFTSSSLKKTFERSYSYEGDYSFEVLSDGNKVDYVVVTIVEAGSLENNTNQDNENNETETEDEKSNEARLSSLTIKDTDGDNISIGFDSSKTTYEIDLTSEETQVTIKAVAWDEEKATIKGEGTKAISVGKNTFEIEVTAEDGTTTQTYTIVINVEAVPVTYLNYNGKSYGLMKELTNVNAPSGFSKTTATINKENVTVFKNGNIILVYGLDENNNGDFYLYREDDGILGIYNPLTIGKETVYLIDVPADLQSRDDMTFETITVSGKSVDAWTFDDEKLIDYVLLYVLNGEGQEDYYVYDGKNQQLLEYPDDDPTTYKEMMAWLEENESSKPNYILYISIAAVVVAIAGVAFWMFKKNKEEDEEDEVEETTQETKEFVRVEKTKKPVIETDLNKLKEADEEEMTIPEVETNSEDDDWLSDDFYKTIMGDDE